MASFSVSPHNAPGSIHVHVDGGHHVKLVRNLIAELNRRGHESRIRHVIESIAGPQRAQLPEVYGSHTPGGEKEEFEYFSTTAAGNRAEAIAILRFILPCIQGTPGIVVEAEQVVALTVSHGTWVMVGPKTGTPRDVRTERVTIEDAVEVDVITAHEVGFQTSTTWPYEVHHRFDVAKTGLSAHPVLLQTLLDFSSKNSMCVGGWFVFDLPGIWGYRSNQFMQEGDARRKVKQQNRSMAFAVHGLHIRNHIAAVLKTTITERVLGIWTT